MNFKEACERLRLLVAQVLCFIGIGKDQRIEEGIKECNKLLRKLYSERKKENDLSQQKHIQSVISQTKSYKRQLQSKRISGSGVGKLKKEKRVVWEDIKSGFASRIRTSVITNLKHIDIGAFLDDCMVLLSRRINNILRQQTNVKINAIFSAEFVKATGDEEITDVKYMSTKNELFDKHMKLKTWFKTNIKDPIMKKLEEFEESKSGWALKSILNLQLSINKFTYRNFGASSYIELPEQIRRKKACVNVKNSDDACFAWAVVSALYPAARNSDLVSSYPLYSSVLNLKGIKFPMNLSHIPRFENLNDISINVFTLAKKNNRFYVESCFVTRNKREKHINLLMIQNKYFDENTLEDVSPEPLKFHFVWIKDLSRLMHSQLNRTRHKKYICDRCLNYFHSKELLEKHEKDCALLNECKILMPSPEKSIMKFKDYKYKEFAPFVIYGDMECILSPTNNENAYQKHIPCSIGYFVKCNYDDTLSYYKSYVGSDCVEWFAKELKQFAEDVDTVFLCPLPMEKLSAEEEKKLRSATHCHICEQLFKKGEKKHLDHSHLTSRVRGMAHQACNVNYKDDKVIPVIFHNLSSYDSHFLLKDIALLIEGDFNVIPCNKEKYISFSKRCSDNFINFRFIDSFRFLDASLEKLAANLTEFPIIQRFFDRPDGRMDDDEAYDYQPPDVEMEEEKLKLLTRKGVFPYDHFDSFDRIKETQLPPIEAFFNRLYNEGITTEDYDHAQKVWEKFCCQNLEDYMSLYLKTDVLLLAEVFEKFRETSHKAYEVDSAHFYTLPGYTFSCMLKHTKIELELLTDIDKVMFIERGIRGGLSQCTKRYAKANNEYLEEYDPSKETSYLMYFDINGMYAWAMSQYLPYGGHEWMSDQEISELNIESFSATSDIGYVLEVDLEYPKELHDLHKDLPFCPEHRKITGEQKLMATLYDKERYVLHYLSLKQALENGLVLKKIHRGLKFKQSPWLKEYIDLNNGFRKQATSSFEKDLFKLMINAIFGKTMENVRNRTNVKVLTKWNGRYGLEARIADPYFKSVILLDEELALVELSRRQVCLNKPLYVGMAILDISKLRLYDFYYSYMKKKFGDSVSGCYSDTDSLISHITGKNIYETIKEDCLEQFDTSDYPEDNIWGIPQVNKKVLGMMKDENQGNIMSQFIGLRSKMYATDVKVKGQGSKITKKIKGVKKGVIRRNITFQDYVRCLQNFTGVVIDESLLDNKDIEMSVEQNLIRSKMHKVSSIKMKKIALNPQDDKRYLIPKSFETLPWGHYSISQQQPMQLD